MDAVKCLLILRVREEGEEHRGILGRQNHSMRNCKDVRHLMKTRDFMAYRVNLNMNVKKTSQVGGWEPKKSAAWQKRV